MRAKFRLEKLSRFANGGGELVFQAVVDGSDENKKFFKYTPSAKIEMQIVNDAVLDSMEAGAFYYVDFVQAESEPK